MHSNYLRQPPPARNSFGLHVGRNIRWVADQLGHSDPALTLRVYAHAMRNEETDLSFAEFGSPGQPLATKPNLKKSLTS